MKNPRRIAIVGGVIKEHYDFLVNGQGNIRSTKIFDSDTAMGLNSDGDNLVLLVELTEANEHIKRRDDTIKHLTTRLAQCRNSHNCPKHKRTFLGRLKRIRDRFL